MSEFTKKRKLHDFWAFILYVVLVASYVVFVMYNTGEHSSPIFKHFGELDTTIMLVNLLFVFVSTFLAILGMKYIPKFFIYTGIVLTPILSIVSCLIAPSIFTFFFCALTCAGAFYMFYKIKENIEAACKVIKTSTSIILEHFLSLISIFVFFSGICFVLISCINADFHKSQTSSVLAVFFVTWTFKNFNYLFDVFTASIVVGHVEDEGYNITSVALNNSVYAIGSTSLGSLLIAILVTARYVLNSSRERRTRSNEDRKSSIADIIAMICYVIAYVVLLFLESIVECINKFAFPYLAVKGTSYKESIIGSNEFLSRASYPVYTWLATRYSLLILQIFGTIAFGIINIGYVISKGNVEVNSSEFVSAIVSFYFGASLYCQFLNVLSSSALGLIYASMAMPEKLSLYNRELSQIIANSN